MTFIGVISGFTFYFQALTSSPPYLALFDAFWLFLVCCFLVCIRQACIALSRAGSRKSSVNDGKANPLFPIRSQSNALPRGAAVEHGRGAFVLIFGRTKSSMGHLD